MEDITFRALNTLKMVDLIAAEDTRQTGKLLAHYQIKTKMIAYHEYNEHTQAKVIVDRLKKGTSLALVSDAGTPSISDPGYRLIKAGLGAHIDIVPIPGVSAAITALSVAGLPTNNFVFIGFLPKKKSSRNEQIQIIANETRTIILYESPKRVLSLLDDLQIVGMGNRKAVLCREMTKQYEEFLRGDIRCISRQIKERSVIKGECTLVIEGRRDIIESQQNVDRDIRLEIEAALETSPLKPSELAKRFAAQYHLPRKKVYEEILKIKKNVLSEIRDE